ncbi:MAG: SDR family oxidoreductase, partial [Acidobacteriales bacterium]|nr:SDR family oxidoreductase [Terriglobales bacterium]
MAIFLTGSTGYIGAYIAANLMKQHDGALNVLVRAKDSREAERRLWQALQLHMPFGEFHDLLQTRMRVFRGDLTEKNFGLSKDDYDRLIHTTDSIVHCAASLNRKSEKSC